MRSARRSTPFLAKHSSDLQSRSTLMPQINRYEQQFLDALKDIFVGAKVEGDSGYINLMKIKSHYFTEGVFPRLMKDIDVACKPFEKSFREELFDKLYDFFKRYFSESGSIYFRHTPLHNNVYEKVYTDDRDVMLFWKTHMLYYVKTDRLFNSMDVDVDGTLFYFDVTDLEHKRSNEKRELVYVLKGYSAGKVVIAVGYSEKGRKTRSDDILSALKEKSIHLDEETLERALHIFEKQSEVDYFINKNAKAFLQEQFDLWLYQYVFSGESDFDENRLKQLQAIKGIAYKIIDFIAQFEDELVRVWNKPKFVLNSHYIITLDKITDPLLLQKIMAHPGMQAQMQEWQDLGMVTKDFQIALLTEKNLLREPAHPCYQYLTLDTRYFLDLELEILALFDDMDAAIDGWLVHSENYQALNTLLPRFHEHVKCVYIDPPYNSAASEIIYKNNYKHASWISLMENRIELTRSLLKTDGVVIVAIDDTEMVVLSQVLDIFLPNHERNTVVVNHHPAGAGLEGTNISTTHEYAIFMVPKGKKVLYGSKKISNISKLSFIRTGTAESNLRTGRPNSFYAVLVDPDRGKVVGVEPPPRGIKYPADNTLEGFIRIYPLGSDGTERVWRRSYESCIEEIKRGNIECQNNKSLYLLTDESGKHKPIFSNWTDTKYNAGAYGTNVLTDILGSVLFSYPKSIFNVMDCISAATIQSKHALILDYFAGSGTTAHAVINLNREDHGRRKYILVEMGEHFHTVIIPRIKKVVFSDKWKDGVAQEGVGYSHFAKYYELEQYEDTLRRARYQDSDLFTAGDVYNSYVFLRDLKMLDVIALDKENNKVEVHLEKLFTGIDLAETLSCVTGKGIKRITRETVEFQDGTSASLTEPEWVLVKPLVWW
jgi:adenine-specific DNA-methyltransferase